MADYYQRKAEWAMADNRHSMSVRPLEFVASMNTPMPPMRTTCERSNEAAITEIEVQLRRKSDHG
jgi:hypothetical protein